MEILSRVRSDINALAPIHALPSELFTKVFCNVLEDTVPHIYLPDRWVKRQSYDIPDVEYTLRNVALVSRAWRKLVLRSPALWCDIQGIFSARFINTCLNRSRSAPLSLYLIRPSKSNRRRHTVPADCIQEHAHRLRNLHIDHAELALSCGRVLSPWTELKAPRLECFTYVGISSCIIEPEIYPKTETLFMTHVSSLKALTLLYNGLWLPSNSFPQLTHLYLAPSAQTFIASWMRGLVEMLYSTPALQFLHVMLLDPEAEVPSYRPTQPSVSLPHLRIFTLESTTLAVSWYALGHLSIPPDALVRMSWSLGIPPGNNEPIVRILPPYDALVVSVIDYNVDVVLVNSKSNGRLWIYHRIRDWKDDSDWMIHLSNLHVTFPLSAIESMWLHADESDVDFSTEILPHVPSLKELHVRLVSYDGYVPEAEPVLMKICDALGKHDSPICLALRTLGIEMDVGSENDGWARSLVKMASSRHHAGRRLERVVLQPVPQCRFAQSTRELHAYILTEGQPLYDLTKHVDLVELRVATDARVGQCPINIGEGWDMQEEKRYWEACRMPRSPAYEVTD